MKMKLIFAVLMSFAMTGIGCSSGKRDDAAKDTQVTGLGEFEKNIELTIDQRTKDNRVDLASTFSFFNLNTGNTPGTEYDWDIIARASLSPGWDEFALSYIGVTMGTFADLGDKSCQDIPNRVEDDNNPGLDKQGYPTKKDRKTSPYTWFSYSDGPGILKSSHATTITIQKGHCYLVFKSGSRTQIIAAFRVKDHVPGKSVVLSEVEVFFKSKLEYNK